MGRNSDNNKVHRQEFNARQAQDFGPGSGGGGGETEIYFATRRTSNEVVPVKSTLAPGQGCPATYNTA